MSSDPSVPPINDDIRRLCQRIDEQGREYWWIKPDVAAAFEDGGYHLVPRHFYSPIPDPTTTGGTDFSRELYPIRSLAFDENAAIQFLGSVAEYAKELAHQFPTLEPVDNDFYWDNPFFTGFDAAALYTMVRTMRPKRIVEIGSGFSTHISLRALKMNGQGSLTCVEPYATSKLLELSDRIKIVESTVQTAASELFSTLESGDILFIDSSHVSCLGSDVNYEIFELLPGLKKGVIIHVHDIFLPFEYPRYWVVDRRWYWNEQYLLYAFLRMNDSFEVLLPNYFMIHQHSAEIRVALPLLGERATSGVSFWMRKSR